MKKLTFVISMLFVAQISFAQIFSWGIKGGVNSSKISFDDFSVDEPPTFSINESHRVEFANFLLTDPSQEEQIQYLRDNPGAFDITAPKVTFTPSSYEMGYHFGAFARVKLLGIFVQPELIFSQTKAAIDFRDTDNLLENLESSSTNITYTNFDIPVMVGVKLGPARLNAGPVATFKLATNVDEANEQVNAMMKDFTEVTQTATFGGQVGVGLDILKKVTIDVRYEFGLSKLGDQVTIGDNTFSTDQRQSQFLASVGWMF